MRKIDKKKMADGYVAMGEINLRMSEDFFLIENEGVKLYEMDTKKTKGKTK